MTMTARQTKVATMHKMDAMDDAALTAMAARLMAGAAQDREMGSHVLWGAKLSIAYTAQAVLAARVAA